MIDNPSMLLVDVSIFELDCKLRGDYSIFACCCRNDG